MSNTRNTTPASIVDWITEPVALIVQPHAQAYAERCQTEYDEPLDRDGIIDRLTMPNGPFADAVWEAAQKVLEQRGLPECVAEMLVEHDAILPLLPRVAEHVDLNIREVAAVFAASHGVSDAAEAASDYVRSESAILAGR